MSFIAFYVSFSLSFLSFCLCLKQKHFLNVLYNQIGIKFMTLQCLSELFLRALASRYRIKMSSEMDNMIPLHRFTKHHISVLGSSFFLCFFSVFFFKPNDSIPYCAYIWACSRGIPLIFGVVLPNFVYFYCFGGWKTNQCRKKNIVFVAFLWSVSL